MLKVLIIIFVAVGLNAFASEISIKLPSALTEDDFRPVNVDEAALGQLLFYDPILSGNKEVACATCHHPKLGTGDGLSLSLGDGGKGLGVKRVVDQNNLPEQRVPRNAQPLFNLGAKQIKTLFHDGRIEVDTSRPSGLRTPLEDEMVSGFASIISAQTMFPVLSADEMAGHYSENEISEAVRRGVLTGENGAWALIAKRVASIDEYSNHFYRIYKHINDPNDIKFTDISNAIAAFMEFEWRSDTAPFDEFLRGKTTFSGLPENGMELFYGEAKCVRCHSGALFTDQEFHAMGQPQLGPGKAARFQNNSRDEGRFRITGVDTDKYAFRTPSLRNVVLTGPWGHAGAYSNLFDFVSGHLDPLSAIKNYNRSSAVLTDFDTLDWAIMDDPLEISAIQKSIKMEAVSLSRNDINALVAFLETLTDTTAQRGRLGIPKSVPSGLKVPNP